MPLQWHDTIRGVKPSQLETLGSAPAKRRVLTMPTCWTSTARCKARDPRTSLSVHRLLWPSCLPVHVKQDVLRGAGRSGLAPCLSNSSTTSLWPYLAAKMIGRHESLRDPSTLAGCRIRSRQERRARQASERRTKGTRGAREDGGGVRT